MFRFVTGFTYLAVGVFGGDEECRLMYGQDPRLRHVGGQCCLRISNGFYYYNHCEGGEIKGEELFILKTYLKKVANLKLL